MTEKDKKESHIESFLEYLKRHMNDRGMMADLRHGFSGTTAYRAWPHIVRWCHDFTNKRERTIMLTVAAGFATHLKTSGNGNMGTVFRQIATGDGKGEKGMESFDARFRRFLACSSAEEVCDHLPGVMRAAERKGILVNFVRLYRDLQYWNERTKVEWASEYWRGLATEGGEPT